MGNQNSSGTSRDRHKSGELPGNASPGVKDGSAFTFENKSTSPHHPKIIQLQGSNDEESEPYYTKPRTGNEPEV